MFNRILPRLPRLPTVGFTISRNVWLEPAGPPSLSGASAHAATQMRFGSVDASGAGLASFSGGTFASAFAASIAIASRSAAASVTGSVIALASAGASGFDAQLSVAPIASIARIASVDGRYATLDRSRDEVIFAPRAL
jgi:hypothetical protein